MMQQYAESNRPRLQLLQMRSHPRINTTADLNMPMPAPNIVTTSSDTKIDTGVQVEVPRQDGFVIEPGLFQVSFIFFFLIKRTCHSYACILIIDPFTRKYWCKFYIS
jgi:hypothetical protein